MMIYLTRPLIGIEAVSTHGDKDQEERNKVPSLLSLLPKKEL